MNFKYSLLINPRLLVLTQTWNKESNSLFDFESNDCTRKSHVVTSKGHLIRHDKYTYFIKDTDKIPSSKPVYMLSVSKNESNIIDEFIR